MESNNWLAKNWRPCLAWSYLVICLWDFMFGSIFLSLYCAYLKILYVPWTPLTLQGGAMYHISMGAILGVSAWSRGQEKIAELAAPPPLPPMPTPEQAQTNSPAPPQA